MTFSITPHLLVEYMMSQLLNLWAVDDQKSFFINALHDMNKRWFSAPWKVWSNTCEILNGYRISDALKGKSSVLQSIHYFLLSLKYLSHVGGWISFFIFCFLQILAWSLLHVSCLFVNLPFKFDFMILFCSVLFLLI